MVVGRILLLLALATPAWAVITVTITQSNGASAGQCNMKGLRGGPPPPVCEVTLTGTGAWTTSNSSSGADVRICQFVTPTNNGCIGATSGTDAAVLRIYVSLNSNATPSSGCSPIAGGYACTTSVTVQGVSIPINLTLLNRDAAPIITTYNGMTSADFLAAGCTTTDSFYVGYPDSCPVSSSYPNGVYNLPPAGVSFNDPLFGTPACVLAVAHHDYSTQWFGSAGGKYFIIADNGVTPWAGIYDLDACTGTLAWNLPAGLNTTQFYPDLKRLANAGLPELTIAGFSGGTIHRATSRGATPPTLTDDGAIWTAPLGEQQLFGGGTEHPSSDGWRIALACTLSAVCDKTQAISAAPHAYLVNLYRPTQYVDINMQDARITASQPVTMGSIVMTDKAADGWRYVEGTANWAMYLRAKDDGTWQYLGYANELNGSLPWLKADDCSNYTTVGCVGVSHRTFGQANGNAFIFKESSENAVSNSTALGTFGFTGDLKLAPVEMGGTNSYIHGGFRDHQATTAAPYPLVVSAFEAAGPSSDNPAMRIYAISGNPANAMLEGAEASYLSLAGLTVGGSIYVACENDNPGTQEIRGTYMASAIGSSSLTAVLTSGVVTSVTVNSSNSGYSGSVPVFFYGGNGSGATGHAVLSGGAIASVVVDTGGSGYSPAPTALAYQLTLAGLNYTGSYTGKCAATRTIAPADQGRYRIQLARLKPNGAPLQIANIGVHYSAHYYAGLKGGSTEYYGQAHVNMTQDGRYIIAVTNNGEPNRLRTIRYAVPWQMRTINSWELGPGYPVKWKPTGSGNMTVSVHSPTPDNIVCTASTTSDLLTSPVTLTFTGPALDRTASFSGVAKTPVYWQCTDPAHNQFAAAGIAVPL